MFVAQWTRSFRVVVAAAAACALSAGMALGVCSPTNQATAEQLYNTAIQFVQAGQYPEAIPSLEGAMEACPEYWQGLELLAQCRVRAKQNAQAARDFERLIDGRHGGNMRDADTERVLKLYGFALLRSKNWDKATEVYDTMLLVDPLSEEAHERLVYVFSNTDQLEKAAGHLEKLYDIVDSEEKRADVATRLGNAYTKLGNTEKAKIWLNAGGGGGGAGMFQVGVDHMKSKEYAQGADAFRSYLKGNPESIAGWKNLGLCLEQLGRQPGGAAHKREAIQAYEKVVAAEPDRHDVQSSLGFLYLDVEEFAKAARVASSALDGWADSDPKKGGMYFLMGKVLEKRDENYEDAIDMFELALGDSYWGKHAEEEIVRQQQLIQIREMKKKQGGR